MSGNDGKGEGASGVSRANRDFEGLLSESLYEGGYGLLLKFVALVEVLDETGERTMLTLSTPDLAYWDAMGMFQYGLTREQANLSAAEADSE